MSQTRMTIGIPIILLCLVLSAAQSYAADRVALLIGNSDYATQEMSLRNPGNDVEALGNTLQELGFTVIQTTNQNARAMQEAVDKFGAISKDAKMAVFFYAGHGVQIGGANYLIGTDFNGNSLQALKRSSITLDRVRDVMTKAGPDVGVLLLDACRNNPFSDKGLVEHGLVRMRGGAGLLIAYATDPGNVAYDGQGKNSVFTNGLLDHIATPDLDVRLMLGRVRQQVVLETDGRQIPWVEESVLDEHSFAPGLPNSSPKDEITADLEHWRRISSSSDSREFKTYLKTYPDGLFASFAREQLASLETPAATPLTSVSATFTQADPQKLATALMALGHLKEPQSPDLGPALDSYRRGLPAAETATPERLFEDAAQVSVYLAVTTMQRLRTDIIALRSVERTLTIAEDALEQIEDIARSNADALPVLQQARSDIYDIYRSRGIILRRLDQSRSYYDEVLARAIIFFPPDIDASIVNAASGSRDLDFANAQLTQDASLFLRHVSQADDSRKGSYQWLADLIPPE
ncbi:MULTISPECIES: caspase family protein [unclassified Ruegeria]|uniref:caspase family protein n=1 Tax=unclassified Ruegeria TaxID=2625375 RepID=UPI001AD9E775|nr:MULTISPECIES: caspase family protein [unclassified Ruegeria]MBO9413453.1 caspase family protein [Ruegeria sp. R8_1]MBO9417364.1 caspase family protein [Ruegeria sp. R8_2]